MLHSKIVCDLFVCPGTSSGAGSLGHGKSQGGEVDSELCNMQKLGKPSWKQTDYSDYIHAIFLLSCAVWTLWAVHLQYLTDPV